VEVVQRYSKHDLTAVGLDRLAAKLARSGPRPQAIAAPRQRHKLQQRADRIQLAAHVVADYQAGIPTTQLTVKYDLGKSSVLRFLREAGVVMRQRSLTETEVTEAIRLYAAGLSVAAVGGALNLNPSTIWRTLTACGVTMRPARNRGSQPA
jgi:hypothetical protein